MLPVPEAERKAPRADRAPFVIIGLAVLILGGYALEARSGRHVEWWNWVIAGLIITNTLVGSLPALRKRPRLSLAISRFSLMVALVVFAAIISKMLG